MRQWEREARGAILAATYSSDPEVVPEFRVPKPRKWWQFWKPVEWETARGVSRAQMQRAQDAIDADLRARARRLREMCPNASPYTNLYAPWLDPPRDDRGSDT